MRAVRIHDQEDVRVESLDEPQVEPGKVLLTGGYTGICGTDLHLYFAPPSMLGDPHSPAKLTGATWPQILGHEFSGEVAAVGDGVHDVQPGDRVAVFPLHVCGACPACLADCPVACRHMAFEGINGRSGGMAETKIVDADKCFVLPDGVDLRLGALVEPMAVAWHGVALAEPDVDGAAVVVGGGPIGLGSYLALKARGVETVIVSEPSPARREILASVGVEHLVDPFSESLPERAAELTGGAGVAVAIGCAGAPTAFNDAIKALAVNGRLVILAVYESAPALEVSSLLGEKSIRLSAIYTRSDFAAVIDAMEQGRYRVDGGWIETTDFGGVEAAIHDLRQGRGMKVLVETPRG